MRVWAVLRMTTTRRGPCPVKIAADGTRIRVEILPGAAVVSSAQTRQLGRALAWVGAAVWVEPPRRVSVGRGGRG